MSYDYNSSSQTFELQNPYKFQNLIYLLCAIALIAAGLYGLLTSRDYLEAKEYKDAAAPIVFGVFLLGWGLRYVINAFGRLRFYFGRGRPQPLAPELNEGQHGAAAAANYVKEMMRHSALTYPEPNGALEGLLYHRIPKLITAPHTVQRAAKYLFTAAAVMLALLLSFSVAALTARNANTLAWLSVLFGVFGITQVFPNVSNGTSASFGVKKLILLVVVAVIGPVLLGLFAKDLPDLSAYSFHFQTALLLGLGFVLLVLLFVAAVAQINPPPNTEVSCEMHPMSLQCPPASVMDELERHLQAGWVEKIPNRRYAYTKPQTPLHAGSGEFWGEILEESQPVPLDSSARTAWSVFSDKRQRLTALVDVLCALFWIAFAGCVVLFFNKGLDNFRAGLFVIQ